jgi:hypothetical protein
MIMTEIFIVVCTLSGQCINHIDIASGVLSVDGCERAIHELAQDRVVADMILRRELSSCRLMPVNTQNDLAS